MKEEDVEDLEEEVVQPCSVENQQPQSQPQLQQPEPQQPQPEPQPQFWPTEPDSHQPHRHDDIVYQEPLQAQPLNTIHHHQSQRHNTIHHHRHDMAYQQVQPQPLITIDHHQPQRHDIEYQDPHQPQPLDTVHDQLPQFQPAPLDSYPPHCHDTQYPQPQPLDAIEYQYPYQSCPLTTYENMTEPCTQDKSNGDIKKVDHALCKNLTPRGVKRKAEEEADDKRKRKKKEEEEGVEASKEELEQPINSHQISDDDDSYFTGFIEPHLLDIDIESINNCCLKKSSDKD